MSLDRSDVGGIVNDPQGMPLSIHSKNNSLFDQERVGVYSNLSRLASQLETSSPMPKVAPLVVIETDTSAVLVKECAGHAVAIRLPKSTLPPSDIAIDN